MGSAESADLKESFTIPPTTYQICIAMFRTQTPTLNASIVNYDITEMRNSVNNIRLSFAGQQYPMPEYRGLDITDASILGSGDAMRAYRDTVEASGLGNEFPIDFRSWTHDSLIFINKVVVPPGNTETSLQVDFRASRDGLIPPNLNGYSMVVLCKYNKELMVEYDNNGQVVSTQSQEIDYRAASIEYL